MCAECSNTLLSASRTSPGDETQTWRSLQRSYQRRKQQPWRTRMPPFERSCCSSSSQPSPRPPPQPPRLLRPPTRPRRRPHSGPAAHSQLTASCASRISPPGRLEIGVDRGADAWRAWRQRWDDYALLTDLSTASQHIQMAKLRLCLGDDTLRVVRNLGIPESEQTVDTVLKKLRLYFLGQVS